MRPNLDLGFNSTVCRPIDGLLIMVAWSGSGHQRVMLAIDLHKCFRHSGQVLSHKNRSQGD